MTLSHLHHSGLEPSRLAMGCEPLGGADWGNVDIPLARRAIQHALELGVTAFDTADVYGLGQSEEELSRALGSRRHEAFIITKFGVRWQRDGSGGRARTFKDSSPGYLRIALESSLRRLKVDSIPLYLVHWPDVKTPLEETLEALERLREEGKILNYGLSNFDAEAMSAAAKSFPVSAVEGPYSLVDRVRGEEVHRMASSCGMACFAYGSLAQGLLTGKYGACAEFGADDRRSRLPQFSDSQWRRNKTILVALAEVSHRNQAALSETAIRWVLDSGYIDTAIVGAKTPAQVEVNTRALNWQLPPEDLQELNKVSAVGWR